MSNLIQNNEVATIPAPQVPASVPEPAPLVPVAPAKIEIGGRPGLDPTRYGDWEKNGRCIDF
jgi:hypothetical protein